jgi:hypothetical protein
MIIIAADRVLHKEQVVAVAVAVVAVVVAVVAAVAVAGCQGCCCCLFYWATPNNMLVLSSYFVGVAPLLR